MCEDSYEVGERCNGRRKRTPQTLDVKFPTITSFLEPSSSSFSS